MNQFGRGFNSIPPVVKNILIINVLMFLATLVAQNAFKVDLNRVLGLFFVKSEFFKPFQIVTYLFMHGGFAHIFFNMFAVLMFGRVLEGVWGSKRFFIFYFVTGIGAALTNFIVNYISYQYSINSLSPSDVNLVLERGTQLIEEGKVFTDTNMQRLQLLLYRSTVGASGAVFGIVMGFGMLFPNTQLMLLFPPIPIKAKYAAILFLALGVMLDFRGNVAHFAHLGGMIFGFFMIKYWNKTKNNFY